MVRCMSTSGDNVRRVGSGAAKYDSIDAVLASALRMEEIISSGVYDNYMNRPYWPKGLEEGTFLEIRQRLAVLIEDTKKHKKIIEDLVRCYDRDE